MARRLLDRVREAGFKVEAERDAVRVSPAPELTREQRAFLRERRDELRAELVREKAVRELDLVPVHPNTGRADVSTEEPAGEAQAEELWARGHAPEIPDHASEVIQQALRTGLTEAGAYELIRLLGQRMTDRRRETANPQECPEGGTCQDCGRDIGPTSTRCGRCKARGGRRGQGESS